MQLLPASPVCMPPKPMLDKIDAHLFLDDAKVLLQGEVGVYKKLLKTLEEFFRDKDIQKALMRLARLLHPYPTLFERINHWLPHGYSLAYTNGKPNAATITFPEGPKSIICRPLRGNKKANVPTRRSSRTFEQRNPQVSVKKASKTSLHPSPH